MIYEVKILRSAIKQLKKCSPTEYKILKEEIIRLSKNPRPKGYKKLKGRPGYRIRKGKFRIIYEIHDEVLIVIIIAVGHRKEIYKDK